MTGKELMVVNIKLPVFFTVEAFYYHRRKWNTIQQYYGLTDEQRRMFEDLCADQEMEVLNAPYRKTHMIDDPMFCHLQQLLENMIRSYNEEVEER